MKSNKYSFVENLALLSVFLSPLRTYGVVVAGFNLSLFRISSILFFLALLLAMFHYGETRVILSKTLLIVSLIWLLSMSAFVYSPGLSGSKSNYMSVVFGFFWILSFQVLAQKRTGIVKDTITMIVYSAIFPIGLGIYQIVVYQLTRRVPPLPFSFLVSSSGKLGLTYNVYVRTTSCFGDPAYFSTFLIIVFGIGMYWIQTREEKETNLFRLLCMIEMLLSVVLVIQMLSFSGVIGLTVVVVLTLLMTKNPIKSVLMLSLGIIATVSIILLIFKLFNYNLLEGILFKWKTQPDSGSSMFGRAAYFSNAFDKFLASPVFGVGFGGLALGDGYFSSAHNSLLTVLGQQGILVFFLYVLLLIVLPIKAFSQSYNHVMMDRRIYVPLIAIIVLSMGYDTMFSFDTTYVMIGVVCVLVDKVKEMYG